MLFKTLWCFHYHFSLIPEFIYVEKSQRALDALYDVIKSKKHRTWQKVHENIMLKYLELCVDLKKSHVAKEGLYQYKNICQQVREVPMPFKVPHLFFKNLSFQIIESYTICEFPNFTSIFNNHRSQRYLENVVILHTQPIAYRA